MLERLIEDLRLLTLAETRQLEFRKSIVDLNELAQRVCYLFQAEAEEKKIQLTVEPSADPMLVFADADCTEQVIGNLVGNALRYVPPGGIVQLKIEHVNADQAAFSVIDNGPGVPEADLPHLFDRFWRGEKSCSRTSDGAGLGLAICKQLIEAQDGTISAKNGQQGGLQIRFSLPTA